MNGIHILDKEDVAAMTLYLFGTGYHLPERKSHWTILDASPLLL